MKKKSKTQMLFNLPPCKGGEKRPLLLRVILSNEHTKVDFGYQTMRYYFEGGWVRMSKDTFIRVKPSGEKLTMLKAENIPIAPEMHLFKTRKDWLYFSLYFPPLPEGTKLIDLIEAEPDADDDFNFFDIELDPQKALELA